jgi:transposase
MIEAEKRARVQKLKEAGLGLRAIARKLGISRNTVREILDPEWKEKRRRKRQEASPPSPSLLEPYKKHVEAILEKDERIRKARPRTKPITTRLIVKEIRKLGYTGGRTIVDDYVRSLRGRRRRGRKAYTRFETEPALEAQQDWTEYRLEIAGKLVKVQIFSLMLAWSRMLFFRAYLDQKLGTLLHGHVAAFRYFEGVPWRITYDRQKTISAVEVDGKPLLTNDFGAFSDHYGFEVFLCDPGDKERKGKVERPFLYLETGFLPHREFESLEDLNSQLRHWLDGGEDPDEGNRRKHGTTQEVPYERWLEEKEYLYPLPKTDLLPRHIETRSVEKDCTVSVAGNRYTVPSRLVESGVRTVWVSVGVDDMVIHDEKGDVVCEHKLSAEKGKLVIDETHYAELRKRQRRTSTPALERQFLERFPAHARFLEELKRTLRSIAPIHLREIVALARRYRREEVERALERALSDGTPTAGYVRELLSRNQPTGYLGELREELPKGLSLGAVDPGSPDQYGNFFGDLDHSDDETATDEPQDTEDDR